LDDLVFSQEDKIEEEDARLPTKSSVKYEIFVSNNWVGVSDDIPLVYGDWKRPFVVVNKPPGIPICDRTAEVDTVERRIYAHLKDTSRRVYFPHRLDKWTSGLLVVAFSSSTCSALGASLQADTEL
jgi:23S rRNA-/tRNA-specific pseudouridylate synthase